MTHKYQEIAPFGESQVFVENRKTTYTTYTNNQIPDRYSDIAMKSHKHLDFDLIYIKNLSV